MVKNRELSRRIGKIAIPHVPRFPFDLGLHSPYIFSYECIKSFNPLENHKQFCENGNFSTSIILLYFLEASHRIIYLHSIVMLVIITFQYHKHSFRVGEIYVYFIYHKTQSKCTLIKFYPPNTIIPCYQC